MACLALLIPVIGIQDEAQHFALVKKIIEQHDGQVGVADPPAADTDTQFWFTLPAAPANPSNQRM